METANLTKKVIEEIATPSKGFTDIRDSQRQYLRIRVTSNGTRTFYYVRKHKGVPHYKALGRYPDKTISEAREACDKENAELIGGSIRKTEKMTFGVLFERYMENHAKVKKRTWKEDQRLHDNFFHQWDTRPVAKVTNAMAERLHKTITQQNGAYAANRVLEIIRKIFNYGIDRQKLDIHNPAERIERNTEVSRERFLNSQELARFFATLNDEQTPQVWRDFFAICLWTGARRGNVQAMQWEHIDLENPENAIWLIPAKESKNNTAMAIALIGEAVGILQRRLSERKGNGKYVFPSRSKAGHITEPKGAWRKIIQRAGLRDLRIHDLRRTLGSWQAETGASLHIIGKSLGHKEQSKATAVYARLSLDPVRQSLNTATAAMMEAITKPAK